MLKKIKNLFTKKKEHNLLPVVYKAAEEDCLAAIKEGDMIRAGNALNMCVAAKQIITQKSSLPYYGEFIGE